MYKLILKTEQRFSKSVKKVIFLSLLAISTLGVTAQTKTVQMPQSNMTIAEAISTLEKQTGYKISYDRSLNLAKNVTVPTTATTFSEVMKAVLKDANKTYEIKSDYVLIKAAPEAAPKPVVAPVAQKKPTTPEPQKPEEVKGVIIPAHTQRIGIEPAPVVVPEPLGNYQSVSNLGKTPSIAIKTNFLYLATTTASLGTEIKLGKKWTLDVPLTHNSWSTADTRRWENFTIQPGVRYWTCEAFNGHFFGVHTHYAKFNMGNLPHGPFTETMRDNRFEGQLVGAGINYGYQWILGKRWALEAEIGAGYAHLWGDRFKCGDCGRPTGTFKNNYFGVTKAGLSLIYIIK